MKWLLIVIALLVTSPSPIAMVSQSRQPFRERKTIIIRVTSSDPHEEVTFAAAYLFKTKESSLVSIEQKTPFEVKERSDFVSGIFRKKSGAALLQVTVTMIADDQVDEQPVTGGGGDIVIIGTQPERNHHIFSQALSQL
jgi:hypothetical protein